MTVERGKLRGIALRAKSRGPMREVQRAEITPERGVVADFRGSPGPRQITLLAVEDWESACAALSQQLHWTTRRANLLVEGISLRNTTGAVVRIGSVELQITRETEPCSRMDEAAPGLCGALTPNWRGGVCCRVISGGVISTDAALTIEKKA